MLDEFFGRAIVYFIIFIAIGILKRFVHDETWINPQIKPKPLPIALFIYALISVIPFFRFLIAVVAVITLFIPLKGSQKYDEWQENIKKAKKEEVD